MSDSRISRIEDAASEGNLSNLKEILETGFRQIEIDAGLVCAVAYSHVEVGEYLLCLGADLSYDNNSAAYYACLLYTSPSPRDATLSRMPSSA